MHELFDITGLITTYGYIGIYVIVFLESGIFFLLPGDSLIFSAGLLAPTLGFNIFWLTFFIFFFAFLGGVAGYYIGSKLEFFNRYPLFRKIVKSDHLTQAHIFLEKHGLGAMILSRFVPVVRTFLPIVAGMAGMKYSNFIRYSLIGSFVWATSFTLSGYFLGRIFPQIENYLFYVMILIVLVSISPGIVHYFKRKKIK